MSSILPGFIFNITIHHFKPVIICRCHVHFNYIGQTIIVPIIYATIIAITLNPMVNFLINKKINKIAAISLAVILVFVLTAGLIFVASNQVSIFADTYPLLQTKLKATNTQGIQWISQHFGLKVEKINAWIQNGQDTVFKEAGGIIGRTLLSLSSSFVVLFLLPVYLFVYDSFL